MESNESVIKAWLNGEDAHNDSLLTNGDVLLYSPSQKGWDYRLELGYNSHLGVKFIYNYTRTGKYISLAVSRIITTAVKLGAFLIKPVS